MTTMQESYKLTNRAKAIVAGAVLAPIALMGANKAINAGQDVIQEHRINHALNTNNLGEKAANNMGVPNELSQVPLVAIEVPDGSTPTEALVDIVADEDIRRLALNVNNQLDQQPGIGAIPLSEVNLAEAQIIESDNPDALPFAVPKQ